MNFYKNNYSTIILFALFAFGYVGCQQKQANTVATETNVTASDTISLPNLVGLKPTLRLTKDAQAATVNWVLYNQLHTTLDSLNAGTMGTAKKQVERLEQHFLDLKEAEDAAVDPMPSDLRTPAIKARLSALETQIKALKNEVSKTVVDPEKITIGMVRSKNAFQDLNLQINERFAMSIEEMIEAANETLDSLVVPNKPFIKDSLNVNNY